jgi:hypothetical protein
MDLTSLPDVSSRTAPKRLEVPSSPRLSTINLTFNHEFPVFRKRVSVEMHRKLPSCTINLTMVDFSMLRTIDLTMKVTTHNLFLETGWFVIFQKKTNKQTNRATRIRLFSTP